MKPGIYRDSDLLVATDHTEYVAVAFHAYMFYGIYRLIAGSVDLEGLKAEYKTDRAGVPVRYMTAAEYARLPHERDSY